MEQQLLNYISGPISWYSFDINGKKIHLFGDRHTWQDERCPGIDCSKESKICFTTIDLIEKIYEKCEREKLYGDVYIESYYRHKETTIRDRDEESDDDEDDDEEEDEEEELNKRFGKDTLQEIILEYRDCLKPKKPKCGFLPHLRFHYVDVRFGMLEDIMKLVNQNKESGQNIYQLIRHPQNILTLLYYFLDELDFFISKAKRFNPNLYFFTRFLIGYFLENEYLFFHILFDEQYTKYLDNFLAEINEAVQMDQMKNLVNVKEIQKYVKVIQDYILLLKFYAKDKKHIVLYELDKLKTEEKKYGTTDFSDKIKKYMFRRLKEIVPLFENDLIQMLDLLEEYKNNNFESMVNDFKKLFIEKIQLVWVDINTLLMDTYTLARMFRNLNKDGKIALLYLGDFHIRNIVRFFKEEFNILPTNQVIGKQPHEKCLQSKNFSTIFDF